MRRQAVLFLRLFAKTFAIGDSGQDRWVRVVVVTALVVFGYTLDQPLGMLWEGEAWTARSTTLGVAITAAAVIAWFVRETAEGKLLTAPLN